MKKRTLVKIIEQYCRLRRLNPSTLKRHKFNIDKFCTWLGRKEFSKNNLRSFVIYLNEKGWKDDSVNSAVSTLKILSTELYDQGIIEENISYAIGSIKRKPLNINPLTVKEVNAIINCPRDWGHNQKWADRRRYDFFFELLARCGLRMSEVLNLKMEDFDFENGFFKVVGKGDKPRVVPIPDMIRTRLYIWLLKRELKPSDWVFEGKAGGRSGVSSFRGELKRRVKHLRINKRVYFHLFRHTWITEGMKADLTQTKMMKIVGHSSPQTIARYAHLFAEDCVNAMNEHPINKPQESPQVEKPITRQTILVSALTKPS